MNKNISLENMTVVFSLEKAEATLENIKNRDIIENDIENYSILKNVLDELRYLKERINHE